MELQALKKKKKNLGDCVKRFQTALKKRFPAFYDYMSCVLSNAGGRLGGYD